MARQIRPLAIRASVIFPVSPPCRAAAHDAVNLTGFLPVLAFSSSRIATPVAFDCCRLMAGGAAVRIISA
ncbi:hypothetical protein [Burkholderia gladioli]|uniref:hypothetical protein n=1 Tax=Burkholderia gladioli TaxID=28095 RepID=UPI00264B4D0A|nr:hypothetical protein [Burkholderia gladioli]MDN7718392.1 hypothetical protein [Burkholderia gladioli]